MEAKQTLCSPSDQKPVLKCNGCEPTNLRNSSHLVGIFEVLQSLQKYVVSDFSSIKILFAK